MANTTPRELPPLDDFLPINPDREIPDRSGHIVIERYDSQGRNINVDARIGWNRPSGPGHTRRERDTFFIQEVQVTERHHLGAAAVNLSIQLARRAATERGINLQQGRMQIITPRMVWVVEKLKDMGIIQDAFYLKNGDTTPHRLPPTKGFERLPNLLPAAEAALYIKEQEELQAACVEPERLGVICCKFMF